MWLSRIAGQDAGSLVSQWGSTIKSPWVCTVTSRYPTPYWACPTAVVHSFIPHRTTSGATIVTVLRPVPLAMCASSNYTATLAPHTSSTATQASDDTRDMHFGAFCASEQQHPVTSCAKISALVLTKELVQNNKLFIEKPILKIRM